MLRSRRLLYMRGALHRCGVISAVATLTCEHGATNMAAAQLTTAQLATIHTSTLHASLGTYNKTTKTCMYQARITSAASVWWLLVKVLWRRFMAQGFVLLFFSQHRSQLFVFAQHQYGGS